MTVFFILQATANHNHLNENTTERAYGCLRKVGISSQMSIFAFSSRKQYEVIGLCGVEATPSFDGQWMYPPLCSLCVAEIFVIGWLVAKSNACLSLYDKILGNPDKLGKETAKYLMFLYCVLQRWDRQNPATTITGTCRPHWLHSDIFIELK